MVKVYTVEPWKEEMLGLYDMNSEIYLRSWVNGVSFSEGGKRLAAGPYARKDGF